MATITISLEAAGLTHAKGKSDKYNGEHDVNVLSVTAIDDSGLIWADNLSPVLQALHKRAHPGGTAYWDNCREPECLAAYELLND